MLPRSLAASLLLVACSSIASADEARQRDEEMLREAKIGMDGPALLNFFKLRTPTEQQRMEIAALIKQFASESFRERNKAATQVEAFGLTAVGMLKQAQAAPDPEIARQAELLVKKIEKVPGEVLAAAVARMLGRVKPSGAAETILAQLPTADNEYVAEGLRESLAQVALDGDQPRPAVMAALTDASAVRRAAAAEALLKAKHKASEPRVREMLKDKDALVRLRVAVTLVAVTRDKSVVPELIRELADAPVGEVWPAEEMLRHLAGEDAPIAAITGEPAARQKGRDAWLAWWTKSGAGIDLKRLDEAPKHLGYTLVCQMNPNLGEGEVKEFAPDGKTVRWQVRGLQLPIDAQFLPQQNRLLVAEYNASTVTDRDLDGKVHKQWHVTQPVACQRLPTGNTFIAHRNGMMEYDAQGKEVFNFQRNMSDIVTARKAKDGTYVFITRRGQCERVNAQGASVATVQVGTMYVYSSMELLPNNRLLTTQTSGVAEYDLATGKQVWLSTVLRNPTSVERLPNGHTLISSTVSRKVMELDREGKLFKEFPLPDAGIPWRVRRR